MRPHPASEAAEHTAILPATENERWIPERNETVQRTTRGLLVWRKSDGVTAFTDGHRTWVDGPFGLQERLNNQRFNLGGARLAGRSLAAHRAQ